MERASSSDAFGLLGLPAQFDLDPSVIERAFFDKSKELHPDGFANAPTAERVAALSRSRALNDAYKMLKNPVARAEYLLSQAGVTIGANEQLEPAFLMEVLELREELVAAIPAAMPSVDEEDCTEIQIFLPSLENTAPEVHRRHRELLHMLSITEEPQSSLPEPAAPHRNAVQHLAWPDALSETEPHTGALSAVQPDAADASQGGFKEKIFAYVQAEITQGHEPTAQEIMDEVHCKQRTAFKYKAEALAALQAK